MRYGMVIDTRACMGCHTCAVKCKQSNNLPNGMRWNRVDTQGGDGMDAMGGEWPNCTLTYFPTACQHCANPACEAVCPTGATSKNPETGIVEIDWDTCIGCQACIAACPYGVRTYASEEPAYYIDVRQGEADVPEHRANVVEKCTMCAERVGRGLEPACVRVCPGRARIWGDLDDPASQVAQLVAGGECIQLLPEAGTEPAVWYLM